MPVWVNAFAHTVPLLYPTSVQCAYACMGFVGEGVALVHTQEPEPGEAEAEAEAESEATKLTSGMGLYQRE